MIIIKTPRILAGLLILFTINCTREDIFTKLTVNINQSVIYTDERGEVFAARYGSLSDGSLHFVKIEMPDGKEYTLPQVVSASGVRYTDEREIVWWLHQGAVRIEARDSTGNWITLHSGLNEKTGWVKDD